MTDIYNDDTYISNNPNLHREDSLFKFNQISKLLENFPLKKEKIKILDVGGGAGELGAEVAKYFVDKGVAIEFVALDLSSEMLAEQVKYNSHIDHTLNCSIQDCPEQSFDIVMMIDVIEHVPEKEMVANRLNEICEYVIYNIPVEINAMDFLRNLILLGRHYAYQTRTIGHVHFFSMRSAKRFIYKHHYPSALFFKPYFSLLLESDAEQYVELRKSRIRLAELKLSKWIAKCFSWISPYLIQGSMYALVATKSGGNHR